MQPQPLGAQPVVTQPQPVRPLPGQPQVDLPDVKMHLEREFGGLMQAFSPTVFSGVSGAHCFRNLSTCRQRKKNVKPCVEEENAHLVKMYRTDQDTENSFSRLT